MAVVDANFSVQTKKVFAMYWKYHIDRSTGKIPEPKMNFDRCVPMTPEGARAWSKFLYGDLLDDIKRKGANDER